MDQLTSLLLLSSARDDQGIYPASVSKGGVSTPRTPWQDGWNAACMDLTRRHLNLIQWFEALSVEQQSLVGTLLSQDAISLCINEDQDVDVELVMNDTFGFAVAECEEVPLADLEKVATLWKDCGQNGLVAYAAVRRKQLPIAPLQTKDFFKAHEQARTLLGE